MEETNVEDLSPTSHILGLIGKLKGASYIIGGHSAHVVSIPKHAPDHYLGDTHRRIVDAGRAIGYSHPSHGLSVRGVIMSTPEGAFNRLMFVCTV